MARLTPCLLIPLLGACVGLRYERVLDGRGRFMVDSNAVRKDETTLPEVLERMGPPDLILRAGRVDRAYYVSWDADYLKFTAGASIPLGGRNVSWDLFILTLGGEELKLVRLEFDRGGVLRDFQRTTFELARSGQYITLDDRIVSTFLEDKARALRVREEDDDEEDVELDDPPEG